MEFCIYLGKQFTTNWRGTLKMLISDLACYIIHMFNIVSSHWPAERNMVASIH
jgi:hypothetical protein